jgi:hypothetical protein
MAPSPIGAKPDEVPTVVEAYYAVTRDMTHFSPGSDDSVAREAQVVRALRRGDNGDLDEELGTGSCIRHVDGNGYTFFYTGFNFDAPDKRPYVLKATSPD